MKTFYEYEQAFEPEREEVLALAEQLADGVRPESIEGYITHGSMYHVFRLEDPTLVAKIPLVDPKITDREPLNSVYGSMQILAQGSGRDGLEQLVGVSLQLPAITCEYALSQNVMDITTAQAARMGPEVFPRLFSNFRFLQERDLFLDADPWNVRFDETFGFTLLDYTDRLRAYTNKQSFSDKVIDFGSVMLFDTGVHTEVPLIGHKYRQACHDLIAPELAMALDCEWEDLRLKVA